MSSSLLARLRARNPLPGGTATVGVGLVVNGLMAFGFLGLTARVLGPEAFAPLGVLWATVYIVGPGFFLPLEQEVARGLANRWARGIGMGPLVNQAARLGTGLVVVLEVATLACSGLLLDHLFDGSTALLVGFMIALVAYAAAHLTRGVLAGLGRFRGYAVYFGTENTVRVAFATVLAVIGVEVVGPYGIVLGAAPLAAVAIALRREHHLRSEGPEAPWSELSAAMGSLLAASVLNAFLVNAGTPVVEILADPSQETEAGIFLAGLAIARVPLFLYQAVQASLLPHLSALAGAGRYSEFRARLGRLVGVVAVLGGTGVIVAFALGPFVVRTLFGPEFELTSRDLALLAAGSAAIMVATALGQSLIALSKQGQVAIGWLLGVIAFLLLVALGNDLFLRVELGILGGSLVAGVAMGAFTWFRLHQHLRAMPHTLTSLDEAVA
jgi:O-antigen/teichoic acid export membrane protein